MKKQNCQVPKQKTKKKSKEKKGKKRTKRFLKRNQTFFFNENFVCKCKHKMLI